MHRNKKHILVTVYSKEDVGIYFSNVYATNFILAHKEIL